MSAHERQLNSMAGFLVAVTRIAENATLVVDNVQQVERDVAHNPGGKTSAIEATQNASTPESRDIGSGQDQPQIEPPTPPEIERSRDFDMGM
jgi:hypothetical protein